MWHFRYLQQRGWDVTYLPVQKDGRVDLQQLSESIRPDTALVSIMAVNNEIGVRQPLQEIGELCRKNKVFFHTDAAQVWSSREHELRLCRRHSQDTLSVSFSCARNSHRVHFKKHFVLLASDAAAVEQAGTLIMLVVQFVSANRCNAAYTYLPIMQEPVLMLNTGRG